MTKRSSFGENEALLTGPLWPASVAISRPSLASQTRAVVSSLAVATTLPSALNATSFSGASWVKSATSSPSGERSFTEAGSVDWKPPTANAMRSPLGEYSRSL